MMHRPQAFLSARNILDYIIAVSVSEILVFSNRILLKILLKR